MFKVLLILIKLSKIYDGFDHVNLYTKIHIKIFKNKKIVLKKIFFLKNQIYIFR